MELLAPLQAYFFKAPLGFAVPLVLDSALPVCMRRQILGGLRSAFQSRPPTHSPPPSPGCCFADHTGGGKALEKRSPPPLLSQIAAADISWTPAVCTELGPLTVLNVFSVLTAAVHFRDEGGGGRWSLGTFAPHPGEPKLGSVPTTGGQHWGLLLPLCDSGLCHAHQCLSVWHALSFSSTPQS